MIRPAGQRPASASTEADQTVRPFKIVFVNVRVCVAADQARSFITARTAPWSRLTTEAHPATAADAAISASATVHLPPKDVASARETASRFSTTICLASRKICHGVTNLHRTGPVQKLQHPGRIGKGYQTTYPGSSSESSCSISRVARVAGPDHPASGNGPAHSRRLRYGLQQPEGPRVGRALGQVHRADFARPNLIRSCR